MFGFPRYSDSRYRRGPVYADPYTTFPTRDHYDYDPFIDPWRQQERARRQKLAEQRQQQRHRQDNELARQQALKRARQAKLKEYQDAATVIQHAWRTYKARQAFEEQNEAAFIITSFMRRYIAVVKAKKIVKSLLKLRQLHKELSALIVEFQSGMRGYRHMLWFNDQVEKLIFKLDEIQHHRSNFVRTKRKAIVKDAQDALKVSDVLLRTMKRKIAIIIRTLRTAVVAKKTHTTHDAARVIQRFMRNLPAVRAAKRDAQHLRSLRAVEQEVAKLHFELADKLQRLQAQSFAVMDTSSDDMVQQRARDLLDKTTTEYDGLMQVQWPQPATPSTKRSKTHES